MRYERIKIRALGALRDVDIDLAALEGPLVAVAGPNGVGKTTVLELMTGGTAHRGCRTRGSLAHLATDRNAFVENTLNNNGSTWTVRHTMDAISGKGESLVLDADGETVLDDTKVSSFDAWSKAHLPSPEVMYSSAVLLQNSPKLKERERGFLSQGRADRMAVLLRVIGMERLEKLAKLARDRATAALDEVVRLRARLDDAVAGAGDVDDARRMVAESTEAVVLAGNSVVAAAEALRRGEIVNKDGQAAQEIRSRRAAVLGHVERARADLAGVDERLVNNRALVAGGDKIREAIATDAVLVVEHDTHVAIKRRCEEEAAELERRVAVAEADLKRARDKSNAAEADRTRAIARLEDKAIVEAAAGTAETQRARAAQHAEVVASLEAEVAELHNKRLNHKDDRISGLRDGLVAVRDDVTSLGDAEEHAVGYLAADDERVAAFGGLPAAIEESERTLAEEKAAVALAQSLLAEAEKLAARKDEMAAAASDLERAEAARLASIEAEKIIVPEVTTLRDGVRQKTTALEAMRDTLASVRDQRLGLEPLLKRAEPLAKAGVRIEELERGREAQAEALATLEAELASLPEAPEDGESVNMESLTGAVARAEERKSGCDAAAGRCASALERAEQDATRIAEMKAEVSKSEATASDWKKLGNDLGRDGLQAMEVDAAVPSLNETVNDLLHTCHGPRFTVEFRTDRLVDGGKSQREALDVRVIDSEKGRDALAEDYSGGELVFVGEAVADGLAVLEAECSGSDHNDLVRDESGAALDPEYRPAYLRMLRRVAKAISARVFFVSHDEWMIEAADAKIAIDKVGNVAVEGTE